MRKRVPYCFFNVKFCNNKPEIENFNAGNPLGDFYHIFIREEASVLQIQRVNLPVHFQQCRQARQVKVKVAVRVALREELESQAADIAAALAQHSEELAREAKTPQCQLKRVSLGF